uniref:hypothetical protein n=1 Tax=uncultured Dubosiella sp. TaxID=1937011 RepID=UPI002730179C
LIRISCVKFDDPSNLMTLLVLLLLAFTMQTSLLLLLSLLLQKVLIETKHRPLYFIEESGISADHAPSRNTSSI